jgi:hypothetical protein
MSGAQGDVSVPPTGERSEPCARRSGRPSDPLSDSHASKQQRGPRLLAFREHRRQLCLLCDEEVRLPGGCCGEFIGDRGQPAPGAEDVRTLRSERDGVGLQFSHRQQCA